MKHEDYLNRKEKERINSRWLLTWYVNGYPDKETGGYIYRKDSLAFESKNDAEEFKKIYLDGNEFIVDVRIYPPID